MIFRNTRFSTLLPFTVFMTSLTPVTQLQAADTSDTLIMAPVKVEADLRGTESDNLAASHTIIDAQTLQEKGTSHFDDLLLQTPNVNFSGQSSRARHIQIRGMGELDDYTGAPNPSVGMSIDGIDFSGIGMTANLFDVKQVEVLRGAQSSRYGNSAIAGLIHIQSKDPTPYRESRIETTVGTDQLREIGLVTSGPFSSAEDSGQYRIAVQKHVSDGFMKNDYLNRTDTNGKDELNVRGKLRFFPSETSQLDVTLLHANLDNGYDAWSLDNTFTTHSDEPGKDTQKSNAGAIKYQWFGDKMTLVSITTLGQSDMTYSYDGDWAYNGYHSTGDNTFFYQNLKDRQNLSQEIRLISEPQAKLFNDTTDWLIGAYIAQMDESNHTTDNYGTDLSSDYQVIKTAGFGQLDTQVAENTTLSTGLRVEQHQAQYDNNNAESYRPSDSMVGANISLTQHFSPQRSAYITVSQGYKAGGVNTGLAIAEKALRNFDSETVINTEIGYQAKAFDNTLSTHIALFHMNRSQPQFEGYTYVGTNYVYYTENFDSATNSGLEVDLKWQMTPKWQLFSTLGLLNTTVKGTSASGAFSISNRDQAHAPNYQATIGTHYRHPTGYFARLEATAVDAFYFDTPHSQKSQPYQLVNARIGYQTKQWEVALWAKNLTDERYATRGFYFANEPTWSITEQYIRLGNPRQIGLTASMNF